MMIAMAMMVNTCQALPDRQGAFANPPVFMLSPSLEALVD
jgi:hypothetical protein